MGDQRCVGATASSPPVPAFAFDRGPNPRFPGCQPPPPRQPAVCLLRAGPGGPARSAKAWTRDLAGPGQQGAGCPVQTPGSPAPLAAPGRPGVCHPGRGRCSGSSLGRVLAPAQVDSPGNRVLSVRVSVQRTVRGLAALGRWKGGPAFSLWEPGLGLTGCRLWETWPRSKTSLLRESGRRPLPVGVPAGLAALRPPSPRAATWPPRDHVDPVGGSSAGSHGQQQTTRSKSGGL